MTHVRHGTALADKGYDPHFDEIDARLATSGMSLCTNCGARGRFTYVGMKEGSYRAFWSCRACGTGSRSESASVGSFGLRPRRRKELNARDFGEWNILTIGRMGVAVNWRETLSVLLALLLMSIPAACSEDSSTASRTSSSQASGQAEDAPDDKAEVRQAFESYRSAILSRDGDAAASLAADSTLDYYEEMRRLALRAPRGELQDRRIIDRFTTLFLRHVVPAKDLLGMTGEDVFAFAIERGWIGEARVTRLDIGAVEVVGDTAAVEVRSSGGGEPFSFVFVREGAAWKIEFGDLLQIADALFAEQARKLDVTQNEFILQLLESQSGRQPSAEIWQPLLK